MSDAHATITILRPLRVFAAAAARAFATVLLALIAIGFALHADLNTHPDKPHAAPALMFGAAAIFALMALSFLLPPMHRALTAASVMRRRWFWPLWFHIAVLVAVSLVFFDLIEAPRSPTEGLVPDGAVAAALAIFIAIHAVAYLWPGLANGLDAAAAARAQAERDAHWVSVHDSKTARWRSRLALALLVPIPAMGSIPAQYFSTLPTPAFGRFAQESLLLCLATVILLAVVTTVGAKDMLLNSRTGTVLRVSKGRRVAKIAVLLGLSLLFVGPAFRVGLPWLVSFLPLAEIRFAHVIVVNTGADERYRGCDQTVLVADPAAPDVVGRLCNLDHDLWHALQVGDRLQVTGPATALGMRIVDVRPTDAHGG